jgi:hypothetical protein
MPQDSVASAAPPASSLASQLFRVAWLAIILGLALQGLLLLAALGFGRDLQLNAVVAETVHKVAWAFLVCFGLALGAASVRAGPKIFAIAGLLAAPIAFVLARALHKSIAQALDVAGTGSSESVLLFAILKAIEYGCLGYLLALVAQRYGAQLYSFTGVGFAIGVLFCAIVISIIAPQPTEVLGKRA